MKRIEFTGFCREQQKKQNMFVVYITIRYIAIDCKFFGNESSLKNILNSLNWMELKALPTIWVQSWKQYLSLFNFI